MELQKTQPQSISSPMPIDPAAQQISNPELETLRQKVDFLFENELDKTVKKVLKQQSKLIEKFSTDTDVKVVLVVNDGEKQTVLHRQKKYAKNFADYQFYQEEEKAIKSYLKTVKHINNLTFHCLCCGFSEKQFVVKSSSFHTHSFYVTSSQIEESHISRGKYYVKENNKEIAEYLFKQDK